MRVIFAGTPEFASAALARLHAENFELPLILTQPDRPAGRGLSLHASSVKQWALQHGAVLAQPHSLRLDGKFADDAAAARQAIEAARPDVLVVAAYGLMLPPWLLDLPRLGCLNIHASLLPRWRGAAPIHRAIEAGDASTGVTIMQMDAGLDTGDMLLAEVIGIEAGDSTGSLHDKLAELGGKLIVQALRLARAGALRPVPQPSEGVSYARKIDKREAVVDWTQSAVRLARQIRAFNPAPGASSVLGGETIKFWQACSLEPDVAVSAGQGAPGEVVAVSAQGLDIATGGGVLRVTRLQKSGGKALAVGDFLRGAALAPGAVFASKAAP
jgi:methionyl-tRNA formyltransferase